VIPVNRDVSNFKVGNHHFSLNNLVGLYPKPLRDIRLSLTPGESPMGCETYRGRTTMTPVCLECKTSTSVNPEGGMSA
jgi:hypothetical protein